MSQNISCIPTGVQLGSKRFPDQREAPPMKAWRCELTALSQLYNLFFVACSDTVYVYQPRFPSQELEDEPALVLTPPVTLEAGSASGIDENDPHSITRILVAYLGTEEVLLMTCDDGDVIGYRVEIIHHAIVQQHDQLSTSPEGMSAVRFFLHRNVGASAWGLAVHRQSRIIAISANTHEITVLAHALAARDTSSPDDADIFDTDVSVSADQDIRDDFPYPRRRDHVLILKAKTNIPSISFDNTGADPHGRWLFSTSIDGKVMVWDIHHSRTPVRIIQAGWCVSAESPTKAPGLAAGYCACPDRANVAHAAWSAVCLDTSSAHDVSGSHEASWQPQLHEGNFVELLRDKERFTIKSSRHYDFTADALDNLARPMDEGDGNSDSAMSIDSQDAVSAFGSESDDSEVDTAAAHSMLRDDGHSPKNAQSTEEVEPAAVAEASSPTNTALPGDPNLDDSTGEDSLFVPGEPSFGASQSTTLPWSQSLESNLDDVMMDLDSDDSDEIELLMPSTAQTQAWLGSMPRKRVYCEVEDTSKPQSHGPVCHSELVEDNAPELGASSSRANDRVDENHINTTSIINCPLLILTKEEIFLYQHPKPPSSSSPPPNPTTPIITMRRPLHPGPWTPFLNPFDRLSFFSQVPPLGLFIVASPVGRAALFTLYTTRDSAAAQPPRHAFRLAYILPFARGRPHEVVCVTRARLAGVAVAPVQGMCDEVAGGEGAVFAGPRTRRWRLLMYYMDHTVVGYELYKRKDAGGEVDVGELVV
ncbi:hypothetical protein ACN47E_003181 [Coniothyrium glycines]